MLGSRSECYLMSAKDTFKHIYICVCVLSTKTESVVSSSAGRHRQTTPFFYGLGYNSVP